MPGTSDEIPPGWYPAPSGGQRYWDGQRWLALPDPDLETVAPKAVATLSGESEWGRKKVVVASVVAAIVLAAAGIGLLLKNNHDTDVRNASIALSSSSKAAAVMRRLPRQPRKPIGFGPPVPNAPRISRT
jgi:hypothetical protein